MSLNETPIPEENKMEALRARLGEFISRNSITQFESEDIVELVEEGEAVDWIVGQLQSNSPGLDVDEITLLLKDIRTLVGPAKEPEYVPPAPETDEESEEPASETEMPDLSQFDPSSLDLSQLEGALPPGMKLPPGFDMKQVRDLMESPQAKIMSDFLLFCSEKGIELDENVMDDPKTQELQDEWKSTPREAFDGKTPAEMMGTGEGGLFPEKVKTFRREEPRVGRNDPCPCGSGKKFKKCCGRS